MKYDYLIDVPTMFRKRLSTLGKFVGYQGKPTDNVMPDSGGFITKTVYSRADAVEMSAAYTEEVPAFYQIDCYFPTDRGAGYLTMAQDVAQLFKRSTELEYNNTKLTTDTVEVSGSPITIGSFEVLTVTVYFNIYICEDA